MKAQRVSKWFAMGHAHAVKKLPLAALEKIPTENAYQKSELSEGFSEAMSGGSHIQFWLVSGEYKHEEIEKLIDGKQSK